MKIQLYIQINNATKRVTKKYGSGFNYIVANAIFVNLVTKNWFSELHNHIFDMSKEENHILVYRLTKTISLCYIRIKMFHEGKKITETLTSIGKTKETIAICHFLK